VLGVLIERPRRRPTLIPFAQRHPRRLQSKDESLAADELDEDAVHDAVDSLREKGVLIEVQGAARRQVSPHGLRMLGIDKREIAINDRALLTRGQTVGELRGLRRRAWSPSPTWRRSSRCRRLDRKKLVVALTPEGAAR